MAYLRRTERREDPWETLKSLVSVHKIGAQPFPMLSRDLKAQRGYRYHYCKHPRSSRTNPNIRFFFRDRIAVGPQLCFVWETGETSQPIYPPLPSSV
jgi:hypothetical protein